MKKTVIYDFDGTLYNGETISDFYFFSAKENKLLYLWLPYFAILLLLKKLHLLCFHLLTHKTMHHQMMNMIYSRNKSSEKIYRFQKMKNRNHLNCLST